MNLRMSSITGKLVQLSEVDGFEVIGDLDAAREVLGGLGGVSEPSVGQMSVLGVVEQQFFHTHFLGLAACVEGGGVVFLVGVELGAVAIEAKGFTHEPITSAHIALINRIVRFIAQTSEDLSIGQCGLEAILLGFRGADIEKCHLQVINLHTLPIVHFPQNDRVVDSAANLAGYGQAAQRAHGVCHLVVAVDGERCRVLALVYHGRDFPYQPHHPQDVVGVHVSHKEVFHLLHAHPGLVELPKDPVAATSVHHEPTARCAQVETRVVTTGAHGVARTKHDELCGL